MKKEMMVLVLVTMPWLAAASGDHAGGHDVHGAHGMERLKQGSHDLHGVSLDGHDADAGQPGDPARVDRTVEITMNDGMRYSPSVIRVKAGETVRFVVSNEGGMNHELVIGSLDELREHAESMRRMPAMQHAEPNMITLAPGQQGGLVWRFGRAGTVHFACLVPGHMEAGMVGTFEVIE